MSASHLHFRNEPAMTIIITIIFGREERRRKLPDPKPYKIHDFLQNMLLYVIITSNIIGLNILVCFQVIQTCKFDNILHNLKYNIIFFLFY